MLKRLIAAATISLCASASQAVVLTFDDLQPTSCSCHYAPPAGYQGFNFNTTLEYIDVVGSSWNYGAHSGEFALLNNYRGAGLITATGGSSFTFDGLWAKKWATGTNSGGTDSLFGTLTGYLNGSVVWTVATSLNGTYEFYGAQAGLIDTLELNFGIFFLVDDIALNVGTSLPAVPLPAGAPLAAGAFGALALLKRRRKAK